MRCRPAARLVVLAALLASALVAPGLAHAGYGVQPTGTVPAQPRLDFLVFLDGRDSEPTVWVSDSALIGPAGAPVGATVGSCSGTAFRPWTEPGKLACSLSTLSLTPGRTYYWWLTYSRLEDGAAVPQGVVSGPFAFALAEAPASPPAPSSPPAPATRPAASVSTKTYASAATLPTRDRYTGRLSIKHARLTDVIYRTMKALDAPRVLAVGCWSEFDFGAVAASADFVTHDDRTTLAGFWLGRQPRWLHLAPAVCTWVQGLLDTKLPTARRAFGLTVALHETVHAYGFSNEAQTNCYAVQLVPVAARFVGLTSARGEQLGRLALASTRGSAPPGYWDARRCRDGGAWDLAPGAANLR
jgi:hypothetical protein